MSQRNPKTNRPPADPEVPGLESPSQGPEKTNESSRTLKYPVLNLIPQREPEKTNGPITDPEVSGLESYLKETREDKRAVPGT